MYFWNYKKLASDFINGKVTEKQKFSYILIPTLMGFIGIILKFVLSLITKIEFKSFALDIFPHSVISSIMAFEVFCILTFMIITYKINSKTDNKDFIGRYFAFKFISMVRGVIFLLGLSLISATINDLYNRWIFINTYELIIIFIISMTYSYYIQVKSFLHLNSIYLLSQKSGKQSSKSRKEKNNKSAKTIKSNTKKR